LEAKAQDIEQDERNFKGPVYSFSAGLQFIMVFSSKTGFLI
jgi:hypothetical protein